MLVNLFRGKPQLDVASLLKPPEPLGDALAVRRGKLQTKLKSAPHRAIEQLGMIGGRHHHDVRRERIDVEQEGAHHALDLSSFVLVASLFPDGIKLVEEDDASARPHVLHQTSKPNGRLAQVATDHAIVTNDEQRQRELASDCLRERGLPVAGWAGQKDAMPRFDRVRTKKVSPVLFFD